MSHAYPTRKPLPLSGRLEGAEALRLAPSPELLRMVRSLKWQTAPDDRVNCGADHRPRPRRPAGSEQPPEPCSPLPALPQPARRESTSGAEESQAGRGKPADDPPGHVCREFVILRSERCLHGELQMCVECGRKSVGTRERRNWEGVPGVVGYQLMIYEMMRHSHE